MTVVNKAGVYLRKTGNIYLLAMNSENSKESKGDLMPGAPMGYSRSVASLTEVRRIGWPCYLPADLARKASNNKTLKGMAEKQDIKSFSTS